MAKILADEGISSDDLLKRDPGVRAAWLWGSHGRGDGDALSDIESCPEYTDT